MNYVKCIVKEKTETWKTLISIKNYNHFCILKSAQLFIHTGRNRPKLKWLMLWLIKLVVLALDTVHVTLESRRSTSEYLENSHLRGTSQCFYLERSVMPWSVDSAVKIFLKSFKIRKANHMSKGKFLCNWGYYSFNFFVFVSFFFLLKNIAWRAYWMFPWLLQISVCKE